MVGLVNGVFLLTGLDAPGSYEPRAIDVAFVAFLVPMCCSRGRSFASTSTSATPRDRHRRVPDRGRGDGDDVHGGPAHRCLAPTASVTAAIFGALTAAQVAAFGALLPGRSSRRHLVLFGTFAATAAATATFGWHWIGAVRQLAATIACPSCWRLWRSRPGRCSTATWNGRRIREWTAPDDGPGRSSRASRPWLRARPWVVAIVDDDWASATRSRPPSSWCSVWASPRASCRTRCASTTAYRQAREALDQKEEARARRGPRRASGRPTTLRESEEHLRLVFETAVDGVVELDERGVVLRANEAFASMVGLPPEARSRISRGRRSRR